MGTYPDRPKTIALRNVTIASAQRAPHEAVYVKAGGTLVLFDTVIANHAVGLARASGSALVGDYNAFFNNGTDQSVDRVAQPMLFANVVTADPQFVDPTVGNFHLQRSSPLIDQGDPNRESRGQPFPETLNQHDIDGEPVPWGPRADIGADEVVGTPRVFAPLIAQ